MKMEDSITDNHLTLEDIAGEEENADDAYDRARQERIDEAHAILEDITREIGKMTEDYCKEQAE